MHQQSTWEFCARLNHSYFKWDNSCIAVTQCQAPNKYLASFYISWAHSAEGTGKPNKQRFKQRGMFSPWPSWRLGVGRHGGRGGTVAPWHRQALPMRFSPPSIGGCPCPHACMAPEWLLHLLAQVSVWAGRRRKEQWDPECNFPRSRTYPVAFTYFSLARTESVP